MKIAVANDHKGYKLKNKVVNYLNKKGYQIIDIGCQSEVSVDYPIYAFELGKKIQEQEADLGIVICATGIGMSIAANKVKGIRCAKPYNAKEAQLAREHNNANVLALSTYMPYYRILDIIDSFLKNSFSNELRHQERINLITNYEKSQKRTKKIAKKETEE